MRALTLKIDRLSLRRDDVRMHSGQTDASMRGRRAGPFATVRRGGPFVAQANATSAAAAATKRCMVRLYQLAGSRPEFGPRGQPTSRRLRPVATAGDCANV